jgi:hypothetical protein
MTKAYFFLSRHLFLPRHLFYTKASFSIKSYFFLPRHIFSIRASFYTKAYFFYHGIFFSIRASFFAAINVKRIDVECILHSWDQFKKTKLICKIFFSDFNYSLPSCTWA